MFTYSLGISKKLRSALSDMGVAAPSPLQQTAIPVLLELDTDVVIANPPATEGLFVYGPALIQRIDFDFRDIQAVILVGGDERAQEVADILGEFGKYLPKLQVAALKKAPVTEKIKMLRSGAQILVSTPGEVFDLIIRKGIDLSQSLHCVVERDAFSVEGDSLDIFDSIEEEFPGDFTGWFITDTDNLSLNLAECLGMDTSLVLDETSGGATDLSQIEHCYTLIRPNQRARALRRIIDANPTWRGLIYCRSESDVEYVYEELHNEGVSISKYPYHDSRENFTWLISKDFSDLDESFVHSVNTIFHYGLSDNAGEQYLERLDLLTDTGIHKRSLVIATLKDVERVEEVSAQYGVEFEERFLPSLDEILNNNILGLYEKLSRVSGDFMMSNPVFRDLLGKLDKYTKEELLAKILSVELSRYSNIYQEGLTGEIAEPTARQQMLYKRLFINLGAMDGFDWRGIREYVRDRVPAVAKEDILNIDVKRKFSFFTVSEMNAELITHMMKEDSYKERKISVEYSSNPDVDTLKSE